MIGRNFSSSFGRCLLLAVLSITLISLAWTEESQAIRTHNEFHQNEVAKANAAVAEAAKKVQDDLTRPSYHLQPPALWNNDPNGPLYYKGEYHMFYQHNPYGVDWGHMHWGHAVSKDLAHWKHLPIALAPSLDKGEEHCFSGCCVVDDEGTPTILYTSIGPKTPAGDGAVQWAAVARDGMLTWDKHPANPVMTEALHGDMKVLDWRDPFAWKENGDWYVVLGGHPKDGRGSAFIYRSSDLVHWKFLNTLYQSRPEDDEGNWECPNYFQLGDKRVLIYSPHRRVMYHTGTMDKDFAFHSERRATLDYSNNFYAPNCLLDGEGRRILWGWIRGIRGEGWQCAMTIPRVLTMRDDGTLEMAPAKEIELLRGKHRRVGQTKVFSTSVGVEAIRNTAKEIRAVFEPTNADAFGFQINISDDKKIPIVWNRKENTVGVGDQTGPFELQDGEDEIVFHLFVDKAIVELYVNNRACCTAVIPELNTTDAVLTLSAENGTAVCKSIDIWRMDSMWIGDK